MASRTMGETRAQSGHSRSSNSIIATFAPAGGLNTEVSLNAVAPLDGIAVCAPAGTTNTRAKPKTKRFIMKPILVGGQIRLLPGQTQTVHFNFQSTTSSLTPTIKLTQTPISPAQAGLHHLTHLEPQPKSRSKVSSSN